MKVLMVGPDRSVQGGISGVVDNWYRAGLDERVRLRYIGTMVDGSKLRKFFRALWSYIVFGLCVSGYDIVHVNMAADASYYRKLYFIKLSKMFHKKLIIHQHGGDVQRFFMESGSRKSRERKYRNLERADVFIVLAPIWKEFFAQMISEDKIVVLPNGIAIPECDLEQKDYDNCDIAYVGRISEEKGIKELFRAAASLRERYADLRLYLGGRWEDDALREYQEQNQDWIVYLGWLDEGKKRDLLYKCSVFVMPSYFEGQGIAVLEGMAYGCAPVATRVGGLQQTFDDGKDGLLIGPRDPGQLAQALDTLLSDQAMKRAVGYQARRKVLERFSLDVVTERLIAVYESLY